MASRLRARLETVIQRDPFPFELRLIVGDDNRVGGGCSQRIERSHDDAQHPLPHLRDDAQHQPRSTCAYPQREKKSRRRVAAMKKLGLTGHNCGQGSADLYDSYLKFIEPNSWVRSSVGGIKKRPEAPREDYPCEAQPDPNAE